MDEKRIEQVLEIENKAQAIHDAAQREAEQLPIRADQEGQALIKKVQKEAEEEANRMIDQAQASDEGQKIIAQAKQEASRTAALAQTNFDHAVNYVLNRIAGKE